MYNINLIPSNTNGVGNKMQDFTISIPEIGLHDFEGKVDFKPCSDGETLDVEAVYIEVPDGIEEYQAEKIAWNDDLGCWLGTGVFEAKTRTKYKQSEISTKTAAHRAFYNLIVEAILADEELIAQAEADMGIVTRSSRQEHSFYNARAL